MSEPDLEPVSQFYEFKEIKKLFYNKKIQTCISFQLP